MSRIAESVSAACVTRRGNLTLVGHIVLGGDQRLVPVRWMRSPTAPSEVPSWAEFEGDPQATPLPWPARYRQVGQVLLQPIWPEEDMQNVPEGAVYPAILWRFDPRTILFAHLPEPTLAAIERSQDFYVRIGGGATAFGIGLVDPGGKVSIQGYAVKPGEVFPLNDDRASKISFF